MIDIERLAREAGMCDALCNDSHNGEVVMIVGDADVQRFAAMVRNEVLEEAANVCDNYEEQATYMAAKAIRSLKTDPNGKLTR